MLKTNSLLIGDLHFGIKNNSLVWLEEQKNFLYKQIFSIIEDKENNISNVVFLGDVTDIRYSVQQQVGIELKNIISKMLTKFPDISFIFVAGNHDYFSPLEEQYKYNSYNLLFGEEYNKTYKNVRFVTESPYYDNKYGYLYLPWYWTENPDHFDELLYQYNFKNDINAVFCHADLSVWPGARITSLRGKPVYSGHIHYRYLDKENKLYNLGAALPLTFNDYNQDRYIYLLDNETHKIIKQIKNEITFKFIRIFNEDILNIDTSENGEFDERFNNSYVQLCLTPNMLKKIEYIDKIKDIKLKYSSNSNIRIHIIIKNENKNENIDANEANELFNYNYNLYDFIEKNISEHLLDKFNKITKELEEE